MVFFYCDFFKVDFCLYLNVYEFFEVHQFGFFFVTFFFKDYSSYILQQEVDGQHWIIMLVEVIKKLVCIFDFFRISKNKKKQQKNNK